ncbi:hypothetical protein F2P81_016689 [Scophthalmus maximus]|uniref:Neural chondroitin sulphate proteoglycan cytoplasmic domain-containing protein n=1 Tax=Scophthalmus maximus TaxID=52904 RepID=A0A6A4SM30_SCOMX|nr:hypothetical protein F2P81_016689 [Scophthalmus maximus]
MPAVRAPVRVMEWRVSTTSAAFAAQLGRRDDQHDYIWHKGARCESVVTEFQVMCLAVGASALVVLLLFMIVVCFAKKLHVLKTENKKLRKRSSKYRPSSEQHNDNFSLSTIAEGSHPNVRKLCDTPPNVPHARALAYYDNIICQKTMSRYTWECKTKEESDCEVTIDLELHLARGTKPKPSRGPFAHYDVYLCRVPRTNPRIPNGPRAQTVNSPGRAKGRVLRWEDDTYPPSPPCSICSPVSTQSLPAPTIAEPQGSRRWTLNPYST